MEKKKLTSQQLFFCLVATLLCLVAAQNLWLILPESRPDAGTFDLMNDLMYTAQTHFAANYLSWMASAAFFGYSIRHLYFGHKALRFSPGAFVLALLFTLFFLLGGAMVKYNALVPVLTGGLQLFLVMLAALGFFLLFYGLFFRAEELLPFIRTFEATPIAGLAQRVQKKHPLVGPMLFFCLCWAPVWLIAFPGALAIDVGIQLKSFYLPDHFFNNHYPYLTTLFYAGAAWLGNALHSPGIALFLMTAIQYFFQAYALGHMLCTLKKLGASDTLRGITMLVLAFVPLWPTYAVCVQKDTPFTSAVIILMDVAAELLFLHRPLTPRLAAGLFGLSLFICITRNNGIYFTLSLLICLIPALTGKKRLPMLLALAALLVSYSLIQNQLLVAVGCFKGERQEMLSIPFQQTARYVRDFGDEVTPEEHDAIDGIIPYEALANYDPFMSDNVKNVYRFRFYNLEALRAQYGKDAVDEESIALNKYFSAWASMFAKHPTVYIEATVNNVYGYVYPMSYRQYGPVELNLFIDAALDHDIIDYTQISAFEPLRTIYCKASTFLGQMPISSLLFSPFFTVWIVGAGAVWLIFHKRWTALVCFIPLLLNIAVCIASPVNGCTRYMYSVMSLIPYCLVLLEREHQSCQ